jgi:hypothetical protein
MMLFRALLLTVAVSAFGQQALKDALGLTESQIWLLEQKKPAPVAPPGIAAAGRRPGIPGNFADARPYKASLDEALHNPILDASQQTKLAEIVKVLDRSAMASEAIAAGLIQEEQWPGQALCPVQLRSHSPDLDLSESQLSLLAELRRAAEAPIFEQLRVIAMHRDELLKSYAADSPEVKTTDNSKLYQQLVAIRHQRDLAFSVLDDAQKSKLAAFENDLKLTYEAMHLKLIPYIAKGEVLCQ